MMLRMSIRTIPSRSAACALLLLAACAGPSPSVDELAAREFAAAASESDLAEAEQHALTARDHLAAQRFEEALDESREALSLDPRHARARAVLARALVGVARQELGAESPLPLDVEREAEGESKSALALAPADPFVGAAHANVLAQTGHLTAALAAAEACLAAGQADGSVDRTDLVAHAAEWAFELGEDRRAISHLRALSDLRPEDATTHHRLGVCLLRTATDVGDAVAASRAFTHCVERRSDDVEAQLDAVKALLRAVALDAKKPSPVAVDAVAAALAAETRFPQSAEASFLVGVAREAQSSLSRDAIPAYERALVRDPEHLPSLLGMIRVTVATLKVYADQPVLPPSLPNPGALAVRALELDARLRVLDEKERAQLAALRDSYR